MANRPKPRVPYVRLGNSGLKISKIILGTMQYGDPRWQEWVIGDEEEVTRHIKAAYDAGIQTFDSADFYSNGASEVLLGKAIKKLNLPRDEIVVLTKLFAVVGREPEANFAVGGNPEEHGYVNQFGLSRKHIFEGVKRSLERLQLDYIDVLQCHRFDKNTPIEETMQALHDVVQAGYVRYIGMSSCYAWQFHAMQNYAITNKLTPFISMQNHYNLIYREEEREMLPTLKHFGVGAICWSPLGRGLLTRWPSEKTTRSNTDWAIRGYASGRGNEAIIERVSELAKKKGVSMAQIGMAWIMAKDGITAPIVGSTSIKNLEDIIGAINITLTPEEMKYLEEPYQPRPIMGHI